MVRGGVGGGGWGGGVGGRRRGRKRGGKEEEEGRGRQWQEWRLRTEEWMEGREDGGEERRDEDEEKITQNRGRGEYVTIKRGKRKREGEKKKGGGHSER